MESANLRKINKMLEDNNVRIQQAKTARDEAQRRIQQIDADVQDAEQTRLQLEDARKKGEAFEESYNAALQMSGVSTDDAEREKNNKKKNNKRVARTAISLALTAAIGVGCYALGRANANGSSRDKDREQNTSSSSKQVVYYLDSETGEYLPYKDGMNVTEFYVMNENGEYVLYEEYFTQQSIDSMAESKDMVISQEEFEKLVASFTKILRDKGISESDLTNTDIMKFVAIVNIENLDPELIEVLRGDETASQFITEAMTITGHITAYNRNYYNQNHNTLGFINVSDAFLEESYGYNSMKLLESYRDQCSSVVNCEPLENFTDENGLVHELYQVQDYETAVSAYNTIVNQVLTEINEGSLVGINHRGCGLAAVMPLFDITETISRAGAWQRMLINDQNYGQMHAVMTFEGPGSVITRIFDEPCAANDIVRESENTLAVSHAYTKRR